MDAFCPTTWFFHRYKRTQNGQNLEFSPIQESTKSWVFTNAREHKKLGFTNARDHERLEVLGVKTLSFQLNQTSVISTKSQLCHLNRIITFPHQMNLNVLPINPNAITVFCPYYPVRSGKTQLDFGLVKILWGGGSNIKI